jgi:hypothetical protein
MSDNAAARDLGICRLYDLGYAQADIARAVALSSGRVRQILDRHNVPKRSACIPALVWEGWPETVPVPSSDRS